MIASVTLQQNVTSEVSTEAVDAILTAIADSYNVTTDEMNYKETYSVTGTIAVDLGDANVTEILEMLRTEIGNESSFKICRFARKI